MLLLILVSTIIKIIAKVAFIGMIYLHKMYSSPINVLYYIKRETFVALFVLTLLRTNLTDSNKTYTGRKKIPSGRF